ncbi:hypothetical protein SISNIDRAFT_415881 [Sistotremastrum niveocremeum HHB9708]|uniref:Malic enzyme n=1 Tax=Sistotremastrum niveocremeum HHB9708 TaxID=1314777 RepID=A0A164QXQ4_9AGAM|nr:hypothetical protein SISNIDRAFT_415881 [Sistotremastrum niveocremeum HHB9708]
MGSKNVIKVALKGEAILTSPRFNKGTAFSQKERKEFGLNGRLPFEVATLDQQCDRANEQLKGRESNIRKNSFLQSLKAQNWVLYYSLLSRHLRELIPVIYTPTEAEAISNYSHLFRRSEGLYLTFPHVDTMEEDFLAQITGRDVDLVVCSDAEAILGIGDQGVGISSAKAVIYTLIGGIDPSKTLPVTLDVGTNNEELLNDPLYVGWPERRVRGKDYDEFIDKFVQLVRKHLPHSLLHFEDFGVTNANRLLARYRDTHAVFNDDVQGTGAVTLAALMAAVGVTKSTLADQRIIIYGAGTAGLGITLQLRDAMMKADSISQKEASSKFWLIDKHGLIKESLRAQDLIREGLDDFVRPDSEFPNSEGEVGLLELVKTVKPTVLIGTSTHGGAFTEEVIKAMKANCHRPIIFPLSNPSRLVEVDPKDANDWTEGMALIATGSPFPAVKNPNGKDYIIAECNNALIYPGLGLGAIVSKTRKVTDEMILAGAQRLASLSPALNDPDDALLPDFEDSPTVNLEVAIAVAEQAIEQGSATVDWSKEEVRERVKASQWYPVYDDYVYEPEGET